MSGHDLSVLEYLRRHVAGTLDPDDRTFLRYPTAISLLLGFQITEIDAGTATLTVVTDPDLHSNQQGTVHGGFIGELADAAIGTARSTTVSPGESFTSIDLRITFLRPMFAGTLTARAYPTHIGATVQHYACDITRDDGKTVATATSTVLTLRGDKAVGR